MSERYIRMVASALDNQLFDDADAIMKMAMTSVDGFANDLKKTPNASIQKYLLEKKLKADTSPDTLNNLLQKAADEMNGWHVAMLLDRGADVKSLDDVNKILIAAAECGDMELLLRGLEMGCDMNTTNSPWKKTPLMCAVKKEHRHIVKYLIEKGCDLTIINKNGHNALNYFVQADMGEFVKMAVERGMNPNQYSADHNRSIIEEALRFKCLGSLKALVECGADTSVKVKSKDEDDEGIDLITYAEVRDFYDGRRYLMENTNIERNADTVICVGLGTGSSVGIIRR